MTETHERDCPRVPRFLLLLAAAAPLVACGTDPAAVPEKSALLGGKADTASLCQKWGFPAGCDLCAEFGWYGDGSCDQPLIDDGVCLGPDPDCPGAAWLAHCDGPSGVDDDGVTRVHVPGDYADPHSAVSALASTPAIVCVEAGQWGPVSVSSKAPLQLVGRQRDAVHVESIAVQYASAMVLVAGVTIDEGADVRDSRGEVTLRDVALRGPGGNGLTVERSPQSGDLAVAIEASDVTGATRAVYVDDTPYGAPGGTTLEVTIRDSAIHGAEVGVDLRARHQLSSWAGTGRLLVTGNRFESNGTALRLDHVSSDVWRLDYDVEYAANTFANNGLAIDLPHRYSHLTLIHAGNAHDGNTVNFAGRALPDADRAAVCDDFAPVAGYQGLQARVPGDYATINAADRALRFAPASTICIEPGIHHEDLQLDHARTLELVGAEGTVIAGSMRGYGTTGAVALTDLTFHVPDDANGVSVERSSATGDLAVALTRVRIQGGARGVVVRDRPYGKPGGTELDMVIADSEIRGASIGVDLDARHQLSSWAGTGSLTIRDTTIADAGTGLRIDHVSTSVWRLAYDVTYENNELTGNEIGVDVVNRYPQLALTHAGNTMTGNGVNFARRALPDADRAPACDDFRLIRPEPGLTVRVPEDYATIAGAGRALRTVGGTICAAAGDHDGGIELLPQAPLQLVGDARQTRIAGGVALHSFAAPVVLGDLSIDAPTGAAVHVDRQGTSGTPSVLIDGCDLRGQLAAVDVHDRPYSAGQATALAVTVQNSFLHGADVGIDVESRHQLSSKAYALSIAALNNALIGNGQGVRVSHTSTSIWRADLELIIANNIIMSSDTGINLKYTPAFAAVTAGANGYQDNGANFAGQAVPAAGDILGALAVTTDGELPAPSPGSPLIGAARADLAPALDALGNPRGAAPSIGPVEP